MLDFHQKRKVRSVAYNRITLGVLFVLFLVFLHSTWSVFKKKQESEDMRDISLRHVEELRLRDDELRLKIEKLATVAGVEEEIRSRFSVAKDRENIVVVVPVKDSKVSTSTIEKSFWEKLKGLFIGS